ALAHPRLELAGLHSHIGSQIFALRAYEEAMDIMLGLLAELRRELGYEPRMLGAGGGLGIAYTHDDDPPTPRDFVETVRQAMVAGCARRELKAPELVVEPGRSIAGPAGMALNYNGMPRPEVLMLRDGEVEVMRRRETLDDLVAAEVF